MPTKTELLLEGYEAWNRDDCEAWLEMLHPDVEIHTAGVFPDLSPAYRGHRRAEKFWRQLHEPWETFRIDVEEIREEEEHDAAIAAVRFRGRGGDSGVEVDMRFANAVRFLDGLAVEFVNRRTLADAREALRRQQPEAPSRPTATRARSPS
jgi:ketosteroid isomerase-like protein